MPAARAATAASATVSGSGTVVTSGAANDSAGERVVEDPVTLLMTIPPAEYARTTLPDDV